MPEFKREARYIVFKLADMEKYVSQTGFDAVMKVGAAIALGRTIDRKPPFNAVVVEQDWPEFEPVWAMIEARMAGQDTPAPKDLVQMLHEQADADEKAGTWYSHVLVRRAAEELRQLREEVSRLRAQPTGKE